MLNLSYGVLNSDFHFDYLGLFLSDKIVTCHYFQTSVFLISDNKCLLVQQLDHKRIRISCSEPETGS